MWTLARPVGYVAAAVTSSLFLTVWMTFVEVSGPTGQQAGLPDVLAGAVSAWPYILGGVLLPMVLPWCVVVWISRRLHHTGPAYFGISAAVAAVFALGTLGWILPGHGAPTTLLEGFASAARTSGLAVLFSGLIGGLTYWLCSEGGPRKTDVKSSA
jgi:hypothetical protein